MAKNSGNWKTAGLYFYQFLSSLVKGDQIYQNQKFWAHNRYFLTYLEKNNIWERKMYPCKKKLGRWESRTFVMVFITFKREDIPKVNYWKFSTKNFFSKCDQIHHSSAEMVTFTEEIFGKFHFLCIASINIIRVIA